MTKVEGDSDSDKQVEPDPEEPQEISFFQRLQNLNHKIEIVTREFYDTEREEVRRSKSQIVRHQVNIMLEERRKKLEE